MKVHIIQHAWFEGPGFICDWIAENGHQTTVTRLYRDEPFPALNSFDLLVIMGGPMSIKDTGKYAWLASEKEFVKAALEDKKPIVGICLGSQLLAEALGSDVYTGQQKEIGWFPLHFDAEKCRETGLNFLPEKATVFHWHSETFDIPENAVRLAGSDAFPNQAFLYDNRVLALQFHLEVNRESCRKMIDNCGNELLPGKWVQSADAITIDMQIPRENSLILKRLLNHITTGV